MSELSSAREGEAGSAGEQPAGECLAETDSETLEEWSTETISARMGAWRGIIFRAIREQRQLGYIGP